MWDRTTRTKNTSGALAIGLAVFAACGKPARHESYPAAPDEAKAAGGGGDVDFDITGAHGVDEVPPDAAAKSGIECPPPEARAVMAVPVHGRLCGHTLSRLGLERGVDATSCVALNGSFTPQARMCRVTLPFYEATAGRPAFCQGVRTAGQAGPQIIIELSNLTVTTAAASADVVGTDGVIVEYSWSIDGVERCRRHRRGHDVRELVECLRDGEHVRRAIENLHRRSWQHLLGVVASPSAWTCLPHRKDQ